MTALSSAVRHVRRIAFPLLGIALLTPTAAALGTAPGQICARIAGLLGDVEVYQISDPETRRALSSGPASQGTDAASLDTRSERAWVKAEHGQDLLLGDHIRTRKGRVRIELTDGVEGEDGRVGGPSAFSLGKHTETALKEFSVAFDNPLERKSLIDLVRGTIDAYIKQDYDRIQRFVTGAGISMAVIRGTEFTMTHDPEAGNVNLSVAEGQVVLSSPEDARLVKAGQSAAMVNGKFLEQPLP